MSEEAINEGDLVRLKSGGPQMTVTKSFGYGRDVLCTWFEGSERKTMRASRKAFVHADDYRDTRLQVLCLGVDRKDAVAAVENLGKLRDAPGVFVIWPDKFSLDFIVSVLSREGPTLTRLGPKLSANPYGFLERMREIKEGEGSDADSSMTVTLPWDGHLQPAHDGGDLDVDHCCCSECGSPDVDVRTVPAEKSAAVDNYHCQSCGYRWHEEI